MQRASSSLIWRLLKNSKKSTNNQLYGEVVKTKVGEKKLVREISTSSFSGLNSNDDKKISIGKMSTKSFFSQEPEKFSEQLTWQPWQLRQTLSFSSSKTSDSKDDEKKENGEKSETEGKDSSNPASENEDLLGMLAQKEVELSEKTEAIEKLKDTVLRTYAEMENLRDRTKREIESSRKFAVQNFAKGLLDVADNLSRAVEVVPEPYRTLGEKEEGEEGAGKLLRSLVEGVLLTEKQLKQVFMKNGLEQYNPIGQPFDPNRHNAVFELPDPEKTPGTVGMVLKTGYLLNDRVIRPADVGIVKDPSQ